MQKKRIKEAESHLDARQEGKIRKIFGCYSPHIDFIEFSATFGATTDLCFFFKQRFNIPLIPVCFYSPSFQNIREHKCRNDNKVSVFPEEFRWDQNKNTLRSLNSLILWKFWFLSNKTINPGSRNQIRLCVNCPTRTLGDFKWDWIYHAVKCCYKRSSEIANWMCLIPESDPLHNFYLRFYLLH